MATDSSKASWRKSTFDPQQSFRGPRGAYKSREGPPRGSQPPSTYVPRNVPGSMEKLPPDLDLMENLHPTPLKTLERRGVTPGDEEVRIRDSVYIGSYNWANCEAPTIIVPGAPRQWLNRSAPYNVQPDIGLTSIDHNGYKMPKGRIVPLIAAVNKRAEDNPGVEPFDWSTVDFVTDRNMLRKLLRWVRDEDRLKDFRIDLELAGEKTVLANRWEAKTREAFSGRTYAANFEKASTEPAPGCQRGSGHHRILAYDFNGLKMVVRFEVDACLPPTRSRKSIDAAAASVDSVANLLAAVDLSSGAPTTTTAGPFDINIVQGGYEAKAPTIMELTTRFEGRLADFDWQDKYPQLYFSQTPHHVLAVHNRGRFSAIQRTKQSDQLFQDLEKEMQPDLKVLRKVLDDIQKAVIESGQNGRITLVCKDRVLRVYARTSAESCLPDHMMALFY